MFKKIIVGILVAVIVVATGASAYTALAAPAAQTQAEYVLVNGYAGDSTAANSGTIQSDQFIDQATIPATLTTEETAGLLFMVEEEKLARDVYNALYALWGQSTFQSIAVSEQAHMDSVQSILDRYGVASPSNAAGVFTNPSLQSLYESLVSTGSQTLADALKSGATIEEVDILDLQTRLAVTTNPLIQLVYTNLMNGSYSHLRAFTTVLTRLTGEIYEPQYLDSDMYQSILSGSNGYGQSYGSYGGGTTTSRGRGISSGTTTSTSSFGKGYRGGR